MVLVHDDNKKRVQWPLGKVIELYYSSDGFVRSARVQTKNGITSRPIKRLYPLELCDEEPREDSTLQKRSDAIGAERPVRAAAENARQIIKLLDC